MCTYLSCLSRCIYVQGLSMNIIIKLNGIWWWFESSVWPPRPPPNVQWWREFGQKWGDDTIAIATDHRRRSFSFRGKRAERPPVQKSQEKGRRRYCSDSYRPADSPHRCTCHPSSRHPCTSQKMEMKEMNEEKNALVVIFLLELITALRSLKLSSWVSGFQMPQQTFPFPSGFSFSSESSF